MDYFAKCGTYRGRTQAEVEADYTVLGRVSAARADGLFYVRLVTRRSRGLAADTEEVQKGQGARDEFRKGLLWLARTHRSTYERNLWLVPLVGRWSDLWHEDTVDALPGGAHLAPRRRRPRRRVPPRAPRKGRCPGSGAAANTHTHATRR